jgi:chromosome segregation ATPase
MLLQTQLEEAKGKAREAELDLTLLHTQMDVATEGLVEAQTRLKELTAEREALSIQLEDTKQAAVCASDQAESEYDALTKQLDEQIALNDSHKGRLTAVGKKAIEDLEQANTRLTAALSEAEELAKLKADTEDVLRKVTSKVAGLERDLERSQGTLERSTLEALDAHARKEQKIAELLSSNDKTDSDLRELQRSIRVLEEEKGSLERDLKKMGGELGETQMRMGEASALLTSLHAKLSCTQQELVEQQLAYETVGGEKQTLGEEVVSRDARIVELEGVLGGVGEALREAEEQWEETHKLLDLQVHTHTYTYSYTYSYSYLHILIHTHTYSYSYIHIHILIHTHTHTYTYSYILIHTPTYWISYTYT